MESSVLDEYEKALIERVREAFDGVRLEDVSDLMQTQAEDDNIKGLGLIFSPSGKHKINGRNVSEFRTKIGFFLPQNTSETFLQVKSKNMTSSLLASLCLLNHILF